MADAPGVGLAFAAGTLSFLSPCCLPLVPGYLATVSGMDLKREDRRVDPRVLGRSALFVATFSLLFVLLGLGATAAGSFLFDNQPTLNRVAGVAIIAMGLLLLTMGVLVLTGELSRLNVQAQQFLDGYGLNFFKSL